MNKSIEKIFIILILVITCISMNPILGNKALAINQTETNDINSIDSNQYPQIKEMLQTLKNQHPNWNFKILYTDIEWNEAIANEYVGHKSSPRNCVYDGSKKFNKLFRRISIYAIIICRMQYSNSKGNGCWNFFE